MAKDIIKIPQVVVKAPSIFGKNGAAANVFKAIKQAVLKKWLF